LFLPVHTSTTTTTTNNNNNNRMSIAKIPMTMRDTFFQDPYFMENWSDFDRLKDAMAESFNDPMRKMDNDMRRQLRCMRDNMMLDVDPMAMVEGGVQPALPSLFPHRWMMPSLKSNLGALDLFAGKPEHELIRVKEDETKLEVSLDTSHYRPEEINVGVEGGRVMVEGRHEEKSEDMVMTRSFKQSFALPPGVQAENVTSNLSADGVLVIEAEKGAPRVKQVPIKKIK